MVNVKYSIYVQHMEWQIRMLAREAIVCAERPGELLWPAATGGDGDLAAPARQRGLVACVMVIHVRDMWVAMRTEIPWLLASGAGRT
jgi:hypothetical protein